VPLSSRKESPGVWGIGMKVMDGCMGIHDLGEVCLGFFFHLSIEVVDDVSLSSSKYFLIYMTYQFCVEVPPVPAKAITTASNWWSYVT
jgi:hypothetical protein